MTRTLITTLLPALLLVLAATAAADEADPDQRDPERPDDAAWVEDCPPDMMCAAAVPDEEHDDARGPEDCEYCRNHQDEDCIDCLAKPDADNTTRGTDCPPDVFCMVNGETDDPDDAGWVDCDGEVCAYDQEPQGNDAIEAGEAPVAGIVLVGVSALAIATIARRT